MSEKLTAIVTTGGTTEYIDDVRGITNFATGALGFAIADALEWGSVETTILSPGKFAEPAPAPMEWEWPKYGYFRSAQDLETLLLNHPPVDIVVHAAAVSDYTPIKRVEGKMSSDEDELIIRLKRTPKIIDSLREHFGDQAYLVGFKLLSGASDDQLTTAAYNQLRRAKTDLVVANDLQTIGPYISSEHPVTLVANDLRLDLRGEKKDVGHQIARFVLREATQRKLSQST